MGSDPWSRPTVQDLKQVLDAIGRSDEDHQREVERLDLAVPAEIITTRGNTIAAMTREISRNGIGLIHRGAISCGDVTMKMASDTKVFEYRVKIEWCIPCEYGMFLSGGRFLGRTDQNLLSPPSDN
ncbi:MAG: PilZ domain-containing protein [Planctomycetota bacterium]|nr:PilZ domain-containing protein [Planctomycetota bacterium]MDA1214199.1 PilZ domain-containing protein [Planctomycetota bacterium]